MSYAELHALSCFSFLRGASRPEELVERAKALGYAALAITDECSVAGAVRAHVAAKEQGLKLIVGAELLLDCGLKLVALATNRRGYGRLTRFITRGRRAAEKGEYHLQRADLEGALDECLLLWVPAHPADEAEARWLAEAFAGNLWIGVELLRGGTDRAHLASLERIGHAFGVPLVACGDVLMHVRSRRALQDAMTAIHHAVPIAEAGWRLHPNGERHLREPARLARLYPRRLLDETLAVAERCTFSLDEVRYQYPRELVPEGETPASYLRRLTEEGARQRWPQGVPQHIRRVIEHELAIIAHLRYEPYFLTVQDIVAHARGLDILCQGRGSAANSVVCYCLGVTAVDPDRASLLMERFISRERDEPPDIDIDFEHERREEVIQYVYRKYGRDRTALAATVITYRPRSALRDLGKAFGLDEESVARLSSTVQWWDGPVVDPERVREAGFDPDDPLFRRMLALAAELVGMPRHLSQHVGGFVIAEGLLEELVPIENAAMPERTVVQWDKDDLDALGLIKVDLLALGMLTALRKAFALVGNYRGKPVALGDARDDPHVYEMISRADTVGVFQIESRAQMAMLPRLKPACYYDLVIEVAIVRPGPIQGDMVHPYLRRREGTEPVVYPKPEVRQVLERTLGVPIFQEQVMQLAMVAAGFTAGEADGLRRAMAAWKRKGGLGPFEKKLKEGMQVRGYPDEFAERIFQQVMGFGEYGFPECVTGNTRIVDADTGRWVTIEDVVSGRVSMKNTFACDDNLRLRKRTVIRAVRSGSKRVWCLRTSLGHSITATAEHPFMTIEGWRKLGELKAGDRIAAARAIPISGKRRWPRHQVLVLADLIAEGNLCHPSTFYFYTSAPEHCDTFVKAVERFPNTHAVIERHRSCFSVRVRRIDRALKPGAVAWIQSLGIWDCDAREKYLPEEVFELCRNDLALLISRLWEGDGGCSETGTASYDTASYRLATQIQHLLLRLGIVARLYRRLRTYKGQQLEHFVVTITGEEPLRRFWRRVGRRLLPTEKRRIARVLGTSVRERGRMSHDVVPVIVRQTIRLERDASGLSWREIGRRTALGMREIQARTGDSKGGFRRSVIGRLGQILKSRPLTRLATSDVCWDRIVAIEEVGDQQTYDLQIEGNHNFIANNLVVHNSHAASFALIAYDTAWLKCYEPAAFTCALLNSQPMGFYAPAQLVRDAREHGVEVRPVRIESSDYDCTLERRDDGEPALRLGLRLVKSLSEAGARRIVEARCERPFASVQDLAVRAVLDRGDLEALAAAGAFVASSGNRHLAFWEIAGFEKPAPLAPRSSRAADLEEGRPLLEAPTEGQSIVADYRSTGLTLGRHPMALLRQRLASSRITSAADLHRMPHGSQVRIAGIVLLRQRPSSASGVNFVTIEDETGHVNLIVWANVADEQRRPLVESRLLEVHGTLQRQGLVTHVVARRLIDRSRLLGGLSTRSRDYH